MIAIVRIVSLLLLLQSFRAPAQTTKEGELQLNTGKEIFQAGCVACHGGDGKGTPKATAGFEPPSTFPDFTDCSGTTPEPDEQWRAIITNGGPGRGFSEIMPSFAEALTAAQIDKVIGYLRGLCREPSWPRGELNLPRALVTEKAYPEDEVVITTAVNAQGAPGISNEFVYERRFGVKNQLELSLPFAFVHPDPGSWFGGVGDVGAGVKRVLFSSLGTGSILSAQGMVILPTGNKTRGLGSGVTTFETFASYGQILPARWFLQLQGGFELPTHTDNVSRVAFWRTALGKSFNQGMGFGRLWSPMAEVVAERDLITGAATNWDVIPEFQVTLSKRQHVRGSVGVRIPFTNTADRSIQVVFYVLWDWFDGKLLEGWK
ncbi:MAG: cytochrome c, class I [Terriglobia bacterium]|nr:MAG: cytochrome c, class I [Terriglobia bacterium]